MARKITSIYIDGESLRLTVSRGFKVSKAVDVPLDVGPAGDDAGAREAAMAAALRQALKDNKVRAKKVVVALSGMHCLSRPALLPQLPRAMLEEAVIREARRVMPVPPEQLYISWQVLSTAEAKTQAFMVAVPRDTADELLGALRQAGLKPELMDIKPLALSRLVPEATGILVDTQAAEFDIVVIVDGMPQPVRTVPFPEEAQSLPDRLEMVADEVRRTVNFYNINYPESPVPHDVALYISGDLAGSPELTEFMADALGYRILPLPSPLKFPDAADPARYLVNAGLALKEQPGEQPGRLLPNLNTLPAAYQPRQISLGKIMAVPAGGVALGLVVLLAMAVQDSANGLYDVQSQLDFTQATLEKRQAQKQELEAEIVEMEQRLADIQASRDTFAAVAGGFDRDGERIDGDLAAAVDNLADGLSLGNISHSGSALNLDGRADGEEDVLAYVRRLSASGRFEAITITSIRLVNNNEEEGEGAAGTSDTSVTFSLSLALKEA